MLMQSLLHHGVHAALLTATAEVAWVYNHLKYTSLTFFQYTLGQSCVMCSIYQVRTSLPGCRRRRRHYRRVSFGTVRLTP